MSLDKHLEPDWVDDYDTEEDELDPDMERDRDADFNPYDRWVETHSWPGGVS